MKQILHPNPHPNSAAVVLMGPKPVELTSQPLKAVRAHVRRFEFDSLTSDQWWVEGEARNLGVVVMAEKTN